jgi:conjugative transfer region protein TrbK
MERSELPRALALILLVGLFVAVLAAINRSPKIPSTEDRASAPSHLSLGHDDLSAELRRCSAFGPNDPEDAACRAAWAENRRHFFNRQAHRATTPAIPAVPESEGAAP